MACLICERVSQAKLGKNPYVIKELENSFLVLGDHQYFKGYCLLIMKDHIEDLTDLATDRQLAYMQEVLKAGKFLKENFKAVRINYSCLGNFVPHVHYHLFPRYDEDLANDATKNPWHCIEFFEKAKLSEQEAKSLALELSQKWDVFLK